MNFMPGGKGDTSLNNSTNVEVQNAGALPQSSFDRSKSIVIGADLNDSTNQGSQPAAQKKKKKKTKKKKVVKESDTLTEDMIVGTPVRTAFDPITEAAEQDQEALEQ